MKKQELIENIVELANIIIANQKEEFGDKACGFICLEDFDFWVNNSDDGNGEDFEVYSLKYDKNGTMGVVCGDDDFFALNELSCDELENLYDILSEEF